MCEGNNHVGRNKPVGCSYFIRSAHSRMRVFFEAPEPLSELTVQGNRFFYPRKICMSSIDARKGDAIVAHPAYCSEAFPPYLRVLRCWVRARTNTHTCDLVMAYYSTQHASLHRSSVTRHFRAFFFPLFLPRERSVAATFCCLFFPSH